MHKIAQIAIFSILIMLCSCDSITDTTQSFDTAEAQFITETQVMSEQNAFSNEISWYTAPHIIEHALSRKLTVKYVMQEMNILLKENEEAKHDDIFLWTFKWNEESISKAKDNAVKHPDKIIAAEYYFTDVYTNYSVDSKYSTIRKRMLKSNT